uniref:Uncharacterized protein n=1 Tax=Arcella intermedia TaxID=1963864 RepID=A0A6B2LTV4_9EUKA
MRLLSYVGVKVFVVMFSVVCRKSFERIEGKWQPEVSPQGYVPFILVGNKIDLRGNNKEAISYEEGTNKASQVGAIKYLECSALTQQGIKTLLQQVAKSITPKPCYVL